MQDENMAVTNFVSLRGVVVKEPEYLYTRNGRELFSVYAMDIGTYRKSGVLDTVRVKFQDTVANPETFRMGTAVRANGPFRSRDILDSAGKHKVELYVYARAISEDIAEADSGEADFENSVFLDGYVCRTPKVKTSLKGRHITEVLLAVNSPNGKSDYIPCICWGSNADLAQEYPVAAELEIEGRIESRDYMRNGKIDRAYEVSVSHMKVKYLPMERGE